MVVNDVLPYLNGSTDHLEGSLGNFTSQK